MFIKDVNRITPMTAPDDNGAQLLQFTFPNSEQTYANLLSEFGDEKVVPFLTIIHQYKDVRLQSASASEAVLEVSAADYDITFGKAKASRRTKEEIAEMEEANSARDRAVSDNNRLQSENTALLDERDELDKENKQLKEDISSIKAQLDEAQSELKDLRKQVKAGDSSDAKGAKAMSAQDNNGEVVNNATDANNQSGSAGPAATTQSQTQPTAAPAGDPAPVPAQDQNPAGDKTGLDKPTTTPAPATAKPAGSTEQSKTTNKK